MGLPLKKVAKMISAKGLGVAAEDAAKMAKLEQLGLLGAKNVDETGKVLGSAAPEVQTKLAAQKAERTADNAIQKVLPIDEYNAKIKAILEKKQAARDAKKLSTSDLPMNPQKTPEQLAQEYEDISQKAIAEGRNPAEDFEVNKAYQAYRRSGAKEAGIDASQAAKAEALRKMMIK